MKVNHSENSGIFHIFGSVWSAYCSAATRAESYFAGSRFIAACANAAAYLSACCGDSFLFRFAGVPKRGYLEGSVFLSKIRFFFGGFESGYEGLCLKSGLIKMVDDSEKDFYHLPVKALSLLVTVSVFLNISASLAFQRHLDASDWLARAALLAVCAGFFSCDTDWPSVRDNSGFINLIRRCRKTK